MTTLSLEAVRSKLTTHIAAHGFRSTADAWGVTEGYLRLVSRGTRNPGPAILRGLGLEKVYVPIPAPNGTEVE